jgi:glycosyltransferase involved in cell wall biosynthesis
MRVLGRTRLFVHPPPREGRIFYHNVWFRGHNNPRTSELLPRLKRIDAYFTPCSDRRFLRGLQYRWINATLRPRLKLLLGAASRRYRWMLTTRNDHIPYFQGRIVADIDDPLFTESEVALLSRSNVVACVVTTELAARRFRDLGVSAPIHVFPHGVSLRDLSPQKVESVRKTWRRPEEIVIGYVASWLLASDDRGSGDPLYNAEHLLEVWDGIRQQVPVARLWIVGRAGPRMRRRLTGRPDVVLVGRVRKEEVLAYVANFDIALYPRRGEIGMQAAKVAEYLGAGVPTVAYEQPATEVLRSGGGVLVRSPADFVRTVSELAADPARRRAVAAAARSTGEELDYDRLAARYQAEVLDRYLTDGGRGAEGLR